MESDLGLSSRQRVGECDRMILSGLVGRYGHLKGAIPLSPPLVPLSHRQVELAFPYPIESIGIESFGSHISVFDPHNGSTRRGICVYAWVLPSPFARDCLNDNSFW